MNTARKTNIYNILSLIFSSWFLFTCWLWAWLFNVIISFPFGLLGLLMWYMARRLDKDNKLNKAALIILILGAAVTIGSLFFFMNR